jgi:hypothetical protein
MALGQWALLQSGQPQQVRVPSGNYLWPTIRVMNPNDGTLYVRQNGPVTNTGYGSWDYKVPAQSFGILPSEGQGWSSAGLYYLDQSGTNRPGEVAVYLSSQTVAEPTFVAIGRSLVSSSTSVDIVSGAQPANPGAGYSRLWIDTGGHLNVLQPSGANYLELDSTTQFGGDVYGSYAGLRLQSMSGDAGNIVHLGPPVRMLFVSGAYIADGGLDGSSNPLVVITALTVTPGPVYLANTQVNGTLNCSSNITCVSLGVSNNVQLSGSGSIIWTATNQQIYPQSGQLFINCPLAINPGGLYVSNGILQVGPGSGAQAGDIAASRNAAPTQGIIYLGNTGTHYLYYDGTNYNLPTSSLVVGGNVTCNSVIATGSLQAENGVLYLNLSGSRLLQYDGTNYNFIGASLIVSGGVVYYGTSAIAPLIRQQGEWMFLSCHGAAGVNVYNQVTTSGTEGTYGYIQAAAFNVVSAQKYKKNIVQLEGAAQIVHDPRLHAYTYQEVDTDKNRIGFIADIWQEIYPDIVSYDHNEELAGMNYTDVIPVLWEALKEYMIQTDARLDKLESAA